MDNNQSYRNKNNKWTIPQKKVTIRDEFDVIVAGGGLGGVAAAISAARAGAKTVIIERNGYPGGVATAGMCCSVFNCFYTNHHKLIVKGIPLEIVDALSKAEGYGEKWHDHKGHIIYDVEKGKLVLIEMLEKAGVTCLFDTMITDVLIESNKIKGVVIDSKSGKEAILAKVVIDASGDSDIAALAEAPIKSVGPNHVDMNSYCFRVGNVNVERMVQYFIDNPEQYPSYMDVDWELEDAVRQYKETGTFLFPHGGGMQLDIIKQGIKNGEYSTELGIHHTLDAIQMHAIRDLGIVHIVTGFVTMSGLNILTFNKTMNDGKRMAFYVTDYFKKYMPGFENSYVSGTADDVGIRVSRWIDGDFVFTKKMKENPFRCSDTIGRAVVEMDCVKNKSEKAWGAQTFSDDYFDIDYRCMLPKKIDNLIMGSGRSISAENPRLLRVMAITMIIGQGAGAAAAVSAKEGVIPREVNMGRVQRELRRQGVEL